jgi:hypothetical protein
MPGYDRSVPDDRALSFDRLSRRRWLWSGLCFAVGCGRPPGETATAGPSTRPTVDEDMRSKLAGFDGDIFDQQHGQHVFKLCTRKETADRIGRFIPPMLSDVGRMFGEPPAPIRVFVFETKQQLAPFLPALLGPYAPEEPNMGRYYDEVRTVTCSMEWGLGWLGDLCLRALYAEDWRDRKPPPARWFDVALQSILYNCFRTQDGTFHGLNVESYYRPQAQQLEVEGRLIELEAFLRDEYDASVLVDDALRVQGREFLAWLLAQGKLRAFYSAFRDQAGADPSGVEAAQLVLGKPIAQLAVDWKRWLMSADAEIGDSEMAKPFPALGILITRDPEPRDGVGVFETCPGGPGERDGLVAGDRITSVDGTSVGSRAQLLAVLEGGAFGRTAPVEVLRNGRPMTVSVVMNRTIDG